MTRAFTLIELLAVIAIASLVAAVAAVGLASSGDQAHIQAAAAQWRDLDAKARAFARCVGPVVMELDAEAAIVRVRSVQGGELLSELALPARMASRIEVEGPERVAFDRVGRSVDYQVELGTGRWQVCGLTGWIVEMNP